MRPRFNGEITYNIRQASLAENPTERLTDLVYQLSAQGHTRQNIYDLYLNYRVVHQDSEEWISIQNKYNGDHPVEIILDRLYGWCAKTLVLLPDEPIQIN